MLWNNLRGRDDQIRMFRRSVARGRLSQAYLFVGPDGTGKRLFAHLLAQCQFCERHTREELEACGVCPSCKQMQAGTHPDFHPVSRPEGKSDLPIALFVGSDDRRGREGLCHDIAMRPMTADRKIAVIDDVDFLNDASANALLKTLEEPPAQAMLILIASNAEGILPTIRSRCQLVRFGPLSNADVAELLVQNGAVSDRAEAELVAGMSEGSLALAAQLLDPRLRELRNNLFRELAGGCPRGMELAKTIMEQIEESAGDTQAQRAAAGWLVRFVVEFYTLVLRELSIPGSTHVADVKGFASRLRATGGEQHDLVAELIDRATSAAFHIEQKIAVGAVLECLFDDLSRSQRTQAVVSR